MESNTFASITLVKGNGNIDFRGLFPVGQGPKTRKSFRGADAHTLRRQPIYRIVQTLGAVPSQR